MPARHLVQAGSKCERCLQVRVLQEENAAIMRMVAALQPHKFSFTLEPADNLTSLAEGFCSGVVFNSPFPILLPQSGALIQHCLHSSLLHTCDTHHVTMLCACFVVQSDRIGAQAFLLVGLSSASSTRHDRASAGCCGA